MDEPTQFAHRIGIDIDRFCLLEERVQHVVQHVVASALKLDPYLGGDTAQRLALVP